MKIESVYIEITNQCNLDCKDCYNSSGKNLSRVEIPVDTIRQYIESISLYNNEEPLRISFSGGEPLLHSKWDDLMDLAESYSKKGAYISAVTNGTVYNERFYSLLASDRKFSVQFSLDGCDEETNSLTRGVGNFEKTVTNIKKNKFALPPTLKMVISQYNKHQVEEYYKFAFDLGCIPNFAFINHMGNAVSGWESKTISPLDKVRIVEMIERLDKEHNTDTNPPYITLSCPITQEDAGKSLLIKPSGNIHPCQLFYADFSCVGNIYNYDHNEFIEKYNNFSKLISARNEMDFGCKKCICQYKCNKGCPGIGAAVYNRLDAPDSLCGYRKTQMAKSALVGILKKEELNV